MRRAIEPQSKGRYFVPIHEIPATWTIHQKGIPATDKGSCQVVSCGLFCCGEITAGTYRTTSHSWDAARPTWRYPQCRTEVVSEETDSRPGDMYAMLCVPVSTVSPVSVAWEGLGQGLSREGTAHWRMMMPVVAGCGSDFQCVRQHVGGRTGRSPATAQARERVV
ncbi:hypothetical protein BO70DRAFT_55638 [Aspergillus heteromorphus CBS 117.55]|uniref:Uncharacterized protein n=1 Tax=Aspergillus heteromorphus CBS 117.55 TaxID=1448321 RepID=A0A317W1N5_9EURO|nr:uncharacterized protein BO70DRAFT_55638 [Aspergillus heteromorphus CBS 117.55]PWY79157.1 hypothetical protein BO70DRAFT_55638 [Aspergillus heteromorphus CBS 117.55]